MHLLIIPKSFNEKSEGCAFRIKVGHYFHNRQTYFKGQNEGGKEKWTVQAIDNLLSNEKYVHIVPVEQYVAVQLEKQKRSSLNSDNTRKTVRHNSGNVLSGLLVCKECGKNFRRITREDGEVVWRCADRVENGKQALCQNMHTVADAEIKQAICDYLGIDRYDEKTVNAELHRIEIGNDCITCISKDEQFFSFCM